MLCIDAVFIYLSAISIYCKCVSANKIIVIVKKISIPSTPPSPNSIFTLQNRSSLCICNSYSMGCPPVRGDNPRALASGLSYVQVDKHGITILYHLHQ